MRAVPAAMAILALTGGAGCGDDESSGSEPPPRLADTSDPHDVTVEMRADGYHPTTVRMVAGGKITWVNTGTRRATAENLPQGKGHFDTHTIYRGQSKSFVLTQPGHYEYHSSYDATTFSGMLIVEPRKPGGRGR